MVDEEGRGLSIGLTPVCTPTASDESLPACSAALAMCMSWAEDGRGRDGFHLGSLWKLPWSDALTVHEDGR